MRSRLSFIIWFAICFAPTLVSAAILPYSVRTRDYSAWTPDTRGDTNTIGMAGATLAVPTSISAAETNPAGFAMLTGSVSAQINKISLNDNRIQKNKEPIDSSQWGLSISPGPWAYGLTYYSPVTESGIYVSPNTGDTVKTEVSLKELRLNIGRSFLRDELAIGVSLEALKAVRELDDTSANAIGFGYRIGALYRLKNHFLLGASFAPQMSVGPAGNPDAQSFISGFNRTVIQPLQAGLGIGWIPSRFFKAGVSGTFVGATDNTALLADQSITTGANATWVPRLGVSYVLAEYPNFKLEGAAGTYFEASRLNGQTDRLHLTAGLEANPYFVNLGAGFDISNAYQNVIVSVGVDIVRSLRAFEIIPKESTPPYDGTLPPVYEAPPPGLPTGAPNSERVSSKTETVEQVSKIVKDVPLNIAKKVKGEPTTVELKESKEKKKLNSKKKPKTKPKSKAPRADEGLSLTKPPSPTPVPSPTPRPSALPEAPAASPVPAASPSPVSS